MFKAKYKMILKKKHMLWIKPKKMSEESRHLTNGILGFRLTLKWRLQKFENQ